MQSNGIVRLVCIALKIALALLKGRYFEKSKPEPQQNDGENKV